MFGFVKRLTEERQAETLADEDLYRKLIAKAADAGGELPAADEKKLGNVAQRLGYPPAQIQDDVAALVRVRDAEALAETIPALRAELKAALLERNEHANGMPKALEDFNKQQGATLTFLNHIVEDAKAKLQPALKADELLRDREEKLIGGGRKIIHLVRGTVRNEQFLTTNTPRWPVRIFENSLVPNTFDPDRTLVLPLAAIGQTDADVRQLVNFVSAVARSKGAMHVRILAWRNDGSEPMDAGGSLVEWFDQLEAQEGKFDPGPFTFIGRDGVDQAAVEKKVAVLRELREKYLATAVA